MRPARLIRLGAAAAAALWAAAAMPADVATVSAAELRALIEARKGEIVVVNFWASWCPPCREEFPDLIEIFDDYAAEGVGVIAVSLNAPDEMEEMGAFLAEHGPPFPVFLAASVDEAFYSGVVEPWFGEIPITLVYDTDGNLAHHHRAPVTYTELAGEVTALLQSR